jgi:hypothetical protein
MLKMVVIAIVAAIPLLLNAGEVRASPHDKMSANVFVPCPAGTCGIKGFPRAKNVKACKASNCPKDGPK